MKRVIALVLLVAVVFTGCAHNSDSETVSRLSDWLAGAELDVGKSPEELYAAALEEGVLVVYSTSTRMFDVAASFEREYPGLIVRVEHIREGELYDKLIENYETGSFAADVVVSADGRGVMSGDFLPRNIVVKYAPHDIRGKILPGNDEDLLVLAGEAAVFSYNELYYPEPPVSNWWELTEEKWRDMIYIPNPVRSMTTLAFFSTIIDNSDLMAQAYEDLFGMPLELPQGEGAGREFVRRLMDNGVVILNSSDEVAEVIGMPGSVSPAVGVMISSKTRLRDIGYEFINHYGMEPFCGVYTPINVMLAGGAQNINAARLFIRWLLGESDGQGEGYRPYLQSGAWSVRSDVQDYTGVRLFELNLLHTDRRSLYENFDAVLSFWEGLLE
jgi:iron(III) transport system substrate-binding protein